MTDGDLAYIQSGTESYTLHNGRELFSFGSGTWFDGSQAVEQMESDADFLSAKLGLETLVIVEKKRILSHLSELPILERAVPLREALSVLEDAGEVRVGISHHTVDLGSDQMKSDKALCFVLDKKPESKDGGENGEPAKKKRRKSKDKKEKSTPQKARHAASLQLCIALCT
ncbi:unnamed protein product [Effrenium voratum]|nr:unnamed protein product [Effrenium voratum]